VVIKDLISGMNKEQIVSLLITSLDLNGKPSPILSVDVNDQTSSALVVFNSTEMAQKCLDLKEIVYFGKVLNISPGHGFQNMGIPQEKTLRCEFKFPSLGAFLECLSKNRGKFEEVQEHATIKMPKLTLTITGSLRTKVDDARNNMSSMLGEGTFTPL